MLYFLFTFFSQFLFIYHLFVKSIFIAENWDSFMLAQKHIFHGRDELICKAEIESQM